MTHELDLHHHQTLSVIGLMMWKANISCFLQELIDVEGDGIADMVFHCIQEMDIDNRMMVTFLKHTPNTFDYSLEGCYIIDCKDNICYHPYEKSH